MKQEEATFRTKSALAASLKKKMTEKPFSKITISEIIKDCDVNRKTFYYHFESIHDLLKWMLDTEAVEVVKQFNLLTDYKEAFRFAIDYVQNNAHILNCAYDSIGREELKRFFYHDFVDAIRLSINTIEKELKVSVKEDFKLFLCNMYAESLAGMIIDFFKGEIHIDKEETVEYLSLILCTALPEVLKNAPKQETTHP